MPEKIEIQTEEWLDLLLQNEREDIYLYKSLLNVSSEPVLELFSNTGRITLELLKENIKVECLETNDKFISIASDKLERNGLKTKFYNYPIKDLNTLNTFNTIFSAGGSFLLVEDYEEALKSLKKIYSLLNNGGLFIVDIFIPWKQIIANQQNLWKIGRIAEDNVKSEKMIVYYSENFDLKNQVRILDSKYELYKNDRFVTAQFATSRIKWFSVNEFSLMLEKVGFSKIETRNVNIFSNQGESTLYIANKLE